MRLRALGTALSVLGVVGIAAAAPASGSGGLPNGFGRADSTNTTAGPVPAGDGVATRRRRRAGCHQFCQQAGGLGGDPTLAPITISRAPVRLRAGVARIYVRCLATTRCDGALVIFPAHSADIVAGGIPPGLVRRRRPRRSCAADRRDRDSSRGRGSAPDPAPGASLRRHPGRAEGHARAGARQAHHAPPGAPLTVSVQTLIMLCFPLIGSSST